MYIRQPTILIVVLPEGGNDIYIAIKQCVYALGSHASVY